MEKLRYAYYNDEIYLIIGIGFQEEDSFELISLRDYFDTSRWLPPLSLTIKMCNCSEITDKRTLRVLEALYAKA